MSPSARGRSSSIGSRGKPAPDSNRTILRREAKEIAKTDTSRCMAATDDEAVDFTKKSTPRAANDFTVVFPRRKAGQDSRLASQPVIISPEMLRHYTSLPLAGVAKVLGISLTAMKKACRSVGVHRWPQCSVTRKSGEDSQSFINADVAPTVVSKKSLSVSLKNDENLTQSGLPKGAISTAPHAFSLNSTAACFKPPQLQLPGGAAAAELVTVFSPPVPGPPQQGWQHYDMQRQQHYIHNYPQTIESAPGPQAQAATQAPHHAGYDAAAAAAARVQQFTQLMARPPRLLSYRATIVNHHGARPAESFETWSRAGFADFPPTPVSFTGEDSGAGGTHGFGPKGWLVDRSPGLRSSFSGPLSPEGSGQSPLGKDLLSKALLPVPSLGEASFNAGTMIPGDYFDLHAHTHLESPRTPRVSTPIMSPRVMQRRRSLTQANDASPRHAEFHEMVSFHGSPRPLSGAEPHNRQNVALRPPMRRQGSSTFEELMAAVREDSTLDTW